MTRMNTGKKRTIGLSRERITPKQSQETEPRVFKFAVGQPVIITAYDLNYEGTVLEAVDCGMRDLYYFVEYAKDGDVCASRFSERQLCHRED